MTTNQPGTPVLRDANGTYYILTPEILAQARSTESSDDVGGFGLPVGGFSLGLLGFEGQPGNQGGQPGQPPGLRGSEGQPGHQGGAQHNP